MSESGEWLDANRANWDERAQIHAARDGSGYEVQTFVEDRALLSEVVRFDLPLLGVSRARTWCICSVTLVRTPSRWPVWVPP